MSANVTNPSTRASLLAELLGHPDIATGVNELLDLSLRALPQHYLRASQEFVHTMRRDQAAPTGLRTEGANLRYAAIVALGAGQMNEADQRKLLAGTTAGQLVTSLVHRSRGSNDFGAIALTCWASAEIRGVAPPELFKQLALQVARPDAAQPTVDFAWALTALVAADELGDYREHAHDAAERLMAAQGTTGIFPHALPRYSLGRYRAHVGCYADQVYPIQALARYYAITGETPALKAASRCADRICELQGESGQWWWHYDIRTGNIIEQYPVYSVHQHAMGPMALLDLYEAGGSDHRVEVAAGLSWLNTHPETSGRLRDDAAPAVWRKVGRREPHKASRAIRSAATAISPQLKIAVLDRVFPPGQIDHECRPYELGWLLYAWLSHNYRDTKAEVLQ